ncbi:PAS domain-containing protein (plasmid) [Rhodococcus opacus]|uniref:PAS domain-containing protein n=1 Tax=Rhodococcus opacus TaxID=37919 RepID=A0ABT4NLF0_RHOOP|nr:PAS domain-containing protein [Rhodococcus opacus]MCZ4588215.1 PAS domain-containing protein [Rhodococcus opacus]MDV7087622.1 PAS domain-containing protein [Rhodococcus opacus]WKN61095.1 PAS domain-containing protein [Rhodococcus opacus]
MEDRRRANPDTTLGYLERLPALVLLARLPVPVLAVERDGAVVHANPAFERMLGYPADQVQDRTIGDLLQTSSPGRSAVAELRESAGKLVALEHRDGSTVRALVSKSVLERRDDPVTLVCFHDVTEQLWDGLSARDF